MVLDILHNSPLKQMSHYCSFGQFDGNMTRNLIVWDARILLNIKKSKNPLSDILPFSGDKYNIFACQSLFFG
jgi:hypothetical protein